LACAALQQLTAQTPNVSDSRPDRSEKLFEEGVAILKHAGGGDGAVAHPDPVSAFRFFQQAADLGNARAMNALASLLCEGNGTPRDYGRAADWYQKAATKGDPRAMYNLGRMEELGLGRPSNKLKALDWYTKADSVGMVEASLKLADFYYFGYPEEGVPKDTGKALHFFMKGAEQGNPAAQNQIGVMCEEGIACQADPVQAAAWYRKSALQGFGRAQNNLGRLYASGNGVPKDEEKSILWLSFAELNGDKNAPIVFGEFSRSMSPSIVASAKQRFHELVAKGMMYPQP